MEKLCIPRFRHKRHGMLRDHTDNYKWTVISVNYCEATGIHFSRRETSTSLWKVINLDGYSAIFINIFETQQENYWKSTVHVVLKILKM